MLAVDTSFSITRNAEGAGESPCKLLDNRSEVDANINRAGVGMDKWELRPTSPQLAEMAPKLGLSLHMNFATIS